MNHFEYEKAFNNKILNKAIMFYGESKYIIESYVSKTSSYFIENKDEILSMYFDEYDYEKAKSYLSQNSLFENKSLLIIKSDKKINKKNLNTLIELSNNNKNSYFIYAYYGVDYQRHYKDFFIKGKSEYLRVFNPNFNETKKIIIKHIEKLKNDKSPKMYLENDVLDILINNMEIDLALCVNEIEKLAVLNKKIEKQDIENLSFNLCDINLENMYTKILQKESFKEDLYKLIENSIDPSIVIIRFNKFIKELFLFKIYAKINGKIDSKEILGYKIPYFIEEKKSKLSLKFKNSFYIRIMKHLLNTELKLKEGNNDTTSLIISSLIKIKTFF